MPDNPLKSLTNYSRYIAELLNRPTVKHSTLAVWSDSPYTGVAEGDVFFTNGLRIHKREELDFIEGIITSYLVVRPTINGIRYRLTSRINYQIHPIHYLILN